MSRAILVALALGALGAPEAAAFAHEARAAAPAVYSTRGVIKAFGADRKSARIAHEKIEGFMPAMTMPFDARSPEQLAGLAVGDKVRFTFTAADDGRLLLDAITKE